MIYPWQGAWMEFHQLRYFVAVAEELSVSGAARRLHLSQPALSRQIAVLEEEMGVVLFDRVRKRMRLSEAGRWLLPRARQILCDAETVVQQVGERFGQVRRTLRLGFLPVFLDDLVAPAVREFRQRHERTQVSLFELPPRAQIERLRARELDAAILGNMEEADREQFRVQRLARHPMAAVLPDWHVLAARRKIPLAALRGEDWVSLSDAIFPGRREFLRRACGVAGFEPRVVAEVDTLSMLLGTVASGGGVGLLPEHARKLPHAGCVFVPLASPVPSAELLLVMPKEAPSVELATLVSLIGDLAGRRLRGVVEQRGKAGDVLGSRAGSAGGGRLESP
jgi:DNA-binding transcriptional LysR family regulator